MRGLLSRKLTVADRHIFMISDWLYHDLFEINLANEVLTEPMKFLTLREDSLRE